MPGRTIRILEANPTIDDKHQRVLDGATAVFLTYGYQRVTMEDIARAAEMSRPALYLLFRNKSDIYRAIAERVFAQCAVAADGALSGGGGIADKLGRAVESIMSTIAEVAASPHGPELLDLKNSLADDLMGRWNASIAGLFAAAIERDAAERGVDLAARGLTALGLAEILMDGLEGTKRRVTDPQLHREAALRLIRVIELAVA